MADVDIEREEELFQSFIEGESLDVISVRTGLAYVECAEAVQHRLAAATVERQLLPELEVARIMLARKALLPAVKMGDVTACREYRQQGESLRLLLDLDKRPEVNNAADLIVAFAFGPEGRVSVAQALLGSGEDDLRSSSDPVDSDGNENGQDGGGVCVDIRRDRAR